MALGNGAPDIFSALAGIGQGRPELVLVINLTFILIITLTMITDRQIRSGPERGNNLDFQQGAADQGGF